MSLDVEPFPIHEIQREWVLGQEALGSKRKFWYRDPKTKPPWLFKYPQANGEHWAEKIAAQVAAALDIFHANVELAVFQGVHGSTTESFARRGRDLFHGNQLLALHVPSYDPDLRFRQANHTLKNIFLALNTAFLTPYGRRRAAQAIANYLVLDALVGNTDRHHENWAILLRPIGGEWSGLVAPTFDHASSLGRELADEGSRKSRQRLLAGKSVGPYSEKGRGAIYWSPNDAHALSPLELVRRGAPVYPEVFKGALDRLSAIDGEALERIVGRIPAGWMSDLARTFAVELMSYNLTELRKVVA